MARQGSCVLANNVIQNGNHVKLYRFNLKKICGYEEEKCVHVALKYPRNLLRGAPIYIKLHCNSSGHFKVTLYFKWKKLNAKGRES